MSRKLATTIKDSAIPGKYKRVLEAYAAFANNDGTNIRPSQTQLGNKAGTSRWTFSRNTADLIESGILRRAQSHTCKVTACNKGATHFTGTWGRYTLVYEIDISLLQNAERYLGTKQQKVNGAKCRKVMGANCYTTQALNTTPVPSSLGITDNSSALTSGSERVSEGELFASLTTCSPTSQTLKTDQPSEPSECLVAKRDQKQNQEQPQEPTILHWHCGVLSNLWLKRTGKPFTTDEQVLASKLIAAEGYAIVEAVLDITLNKREKSAKMVWRRFKVFADNWQTNYDLCKSWYAAKSAKKEYVREIPAKFDLTPFRKDEEKNSRDYFTANCKAGEWELTAEQWKATGASNDHFRAALRFCCDNARIVTKAEFIDLVFEAMGNVNFEAMSLATGAGLDLEEA